MRVLRCAERNILGAVIEVFTPMAKSHKGGHSAVPPTFGSSGLQTSPPSDPPSYVRFELKRDNDRDLHFDGVQLFCVESAGTPSVHRAAIYRTRGGKHVTEFSMRNSLPDERLGRPPAEYLEQLRRNLWERIEEFVDDNSDNKDYGEAATFLAEVPETLKQLHDVDRRWERLWRLRETHSDALVDEVEIKFLREARPIYGPQTARQFLDLLIHAIERHAAANSVLSSKVSVVDSLDDAFATFRPGRLTNELLRQAGRFGPEFIE